MKNGNKAWWQSKSILGGVMATVASGMAMYAQSKGISVSEGESMMALSGMMGGIGGMLAIIGRLTASKTLE